MKRLFALFAAVAALLAISQAPVSASVPDWDKAITWERAGYSLDVAQELRAEGLVVKTPAEWDAVKVAEGRLAPVDCPNTDKMCLWNGYGWTGTMWALPSQWLQDGDNGLVNGLSFYGSGINNASKGWYNRTGIPARMYDRDDCQMVSGDFRRDMTAGQVAVSYNASTNDWENRFSSISTIQDAGNYCTNVPGQ